MLLKPYKPSNRVPWNLQRVWSLHRRTCFAGTWEELQRDLSDGPENSITRIFDGQVRAAGKPNDFTRLQELLGESAVASRRPERLTAWWIYLMYFSPSPLRERLCGMWHNHFATSNAKVKNLGLMRNQNQLFRQLGAGPFKPLLTAVLTQPAMLQWLDGDKNRVGKPNENLGRELLELFSLGSGHFNEQDVKEVSRALTGWTVERDQFRVRNDWHDSAEKTVLGKTGDFDGYDVIDIVCEHDQAPRRLAWRIGNEFLASSLVTEPLVEELATALRADNLKIDTALRLLVSSELFFSKENINRRIIEPESFVVGNVRALEHFTPPANTMILGEWIQQLGRKLFYPPNVGGWTGGKAWLNSRTAIARANFGAALVHGRLGKASVPVDLVKLATDHDIKETPVSLCGFYLKLLTGGSSIGQVDRLVNSHWATRDNDLNTKMQNVVANIIASPEAQLS